MSQATTPSRASNQPRAPQAPPSGGAEKAVLIASAAALALAVALLSTDRWVEWLYPEQLHHLQQAGELTEVHADVKRKLAGDFHWAQVSPQQKVYEGDSLFTGADSTASVHLLSGASIQLEPSTLLVLKRSLHFTEIELHQGKATSSLERGQRLVIHGKHGTLEVTGTAASGRSELRFAATAPGSGRLDLQVRSGQVEVRSGSHTQDLTRGQEAEETQDTAAGGALKVSSHRLEASHPAEGERVYKTEDELVPFTWRGVAGAASYRIEAAYDPEFRLQLASQEADRSSCSPAPGDPSELSCGATLTLKATGVLYWRVTTPLGESSPVTRFRLQYLSAPSPLYPAYDDVVEAGALRFQWSDRNRAPSYLLQVSNEKDFSTRKIEQEVSGAVADARELPDGIYYWRVRAQGGEAPGQWSRVSVFRVQKQLLLNAPSPASPIEGAAFTLGAGGASVGFQWGARPGATRYGLEISTHPDFQPVLFAETLARTAYAWSATAPGTYYWRVRAQDDQGQTTVYSDTRTFVVK